MGFFDNIRNRLQTWLIPEEYYADPVRRQRMDRMLTYRAYSRGDQEKQIKVKVGQADDNLILNFSGLVIERSLSLLFGGGISFDIGEDTTEDEYIADVWKANKQAILLHKLGQFGGSSGTMYLKIMPDEIDGLPRLMPIDPIWMNIKTSPTDIDRVMEYENVYYIKSGEDTIGYKEVITRQETGWLVEQYEKHRANWVQVANIPWDYDFPPIIHWQNLTNAESPYGMSDIEDTILIQDKINFISSNINRIIRYHAHPKTWGSGFGDTSSASWGPDEMVILNSETGKLHNLEMQSDLTASQQFLLTLRQSIFDIARTVDLTSISDKLGALTNFGLRVLYQDALAKLGTKRELWSEALVEINRRLLVLNGADGADGGKVIWPEQVLPIDRKADAEAYKLDLEMGLVSTETVSKKRGYDWTNEQERIETQKLNEGNVGADILRAFNIGA